MKRRTPPLEIMRAELLLMGYRQHRNYEKWWVGPNHTLYTSTRNAWRAMQYEIERIQQ